MLPHYSSQDLRGLEVGPRVEAECMRHFPPGEELIDVLCGAVAPRHGGIARDLEWAHHTIMVIR